MNFYEQLKILSKKRITSFHTGKDSFYNGSGTYFSKLIEEVAEAASENRNNNVVYLEDELGDIFWDYICLVHSLESEKKITGIDEVFKRAYKKYTQRLGENGDGKGIIWENIKKIQKEDLKKEHHCLYGE